MQQSTLDKLFDIIWPIEKHELKKFLPMAGLMICILFNYNSLRALKDALVVPNIGAEAISFIKLYCVVPAAIVLMLVYAKLTNIASQQTIFYSFATFFLVWFIVFAFILYPNTATIHPDQKSVEQLIAEDVSLGIFTLDLVHFKWFLLIYSKWSFALFYVLAELWGSAMLSLMFWQFANHITQTKDARRLYPMFGFIGNIGLIIAGSALNYFFSIQIESDAALANNAINQDAHIAVQALLSLTSISVILIMCIFFYMQKYVLTDPQYLNATTKQTKENNHKLSLVGSFKVILSSKYLGHVVIIVLAYGIATNLVEGPWKAKVRALYPDTNAYACFMGNLSLYTGLASMLFMIIGTNILTKFGWLVGALITPIVLCVTGVSFFIFVVFYNAASISMVGVVLDPLLLAVVFGLIQNVLSKATKYSLFDPTKEMSYIPIDEELKTKGKAAVDIVGARVAKSGAALIQSGLFMIFPAATFVVISPYLMAIFVIVVLIWILNVKMLSKEYFKSLAKILS